MEDGFVDQFPLCDHSGVGQVHSCRYGKHNKPIIYPSLTSTICIDCNNTQLYGIFSGFNGGERTAKFVMNRIVYEIFQENPINVAMRPFEICVALMQKFEVVAQRYFRMNCDDLTNRTIAKDTESEPNKTIISEIDKRIREGTTVILLLKMDRDLYLVNCGCSIALAITQNEGKAIQLNTILHENDDPIEIERLTNINVDPQTVLNPTRAIGDLHRSHLYDEKDEFEHAKGPPVIAEPDVQHFEIQDDWKYILLLSDGVVQNLKEIEVEDIPTEVSVKLIEDNTPTSTAQALVDGFARKHQDAYIRMKDEQRCSMSSHREEMTVVFIKLPTHHMDAYTDDSAFSTMDSTNASVEYHGPLQPYIDITKNTDTENFKAMEKLILQKNNS